MAKADRLLVGLGVLALIGVIATFALGRWQTGRAQDKDERQARLQAAISTAPTVLDSNAVDVSSLLNARVSARGQFLAMRTILLDNRLRQGKAGYEVLTPLDFGNGKSVLINRGWLPAGADRRVLPAVSTPSGVVEIEAIVLPVKADFVELSNETVSGSLWQNLDFPRYVQQSGLDLLPLVLQQRSELPDGLSRDWPPPNLRVDTHRAYAMQWYTMSVAIAVAYMVFYVRRKRA
ncbi:MAG: SURF1 family protein [Betaproteobacteria bacterium]|nr:SURF1 family protein [Betaproteobacteria bacterium]